MKKQILVPSIAIMLLNIVAFASQAESICCGFSSIVPSAVSVKARIKMDDIPKKEDLNNHDAGSSVEGSSRKAQLYFRGNRSNTLFVNHSNDRIIHN